MRYAVVTTMHRGGLDTYGHKFLESFCANWPTEVDLICFAEGWSRDDVDGLGIESRDNIYLRDLDDECPDLVAFKERHHAPGPPRGLVDGRNYNYRFDAVRFAHKIFALARAWEMVDGKGYDYLIWLDADVVTHTPIPMDFLDSLLPAPRDLAYLKRDTTFDYPECGFVVYNVRKADGPAPTIIRMMRELWRNDQVFGLPEWHDSFVFNVLVTGFQMNELIRTRSLSGGFEGHEHPFVNGPLGAYMDHLKGPIRKKRGVSLGQDIVADERGEGYWQDIKGRDQDAPVTDAAE